MVLEAPEQGPLAGRPAAAAAVRLPRPDCPLCHLPHPPLPHPPTPPPPLPLPTLPQCPNGKECKYRHALPPGYVLKSQMKELLELEAANVRALELRWWWW